MELTMWVTKMGELNAVLHVMFISILRKSNKPIFIPNLDNRPLFFHSKKSLKGATLGIACGPDQVEWGGRGLGPVGEGGGA